MSLENWKIVKAQKRLNPGQFLPGLKIDHSGIRWQPRLCITVDPVILPA